MSLGILIVAGLGGQRVYFAPVEFPLLSGKTSNPESTQVHGGKRVDHGQWIFWFGFRMGDFAGKSIAIFLTSVTCRLPRIDLASFQKVGLQGW
jgi:IS4 transposase